MLIAIDLKYVPQPRGVSALQHLDEISRMLNGLIGSLTPE
jgi:hypothetical protein